MPLAETASCGPSSPPVLPVQHSLYPSLGPLPTLHTPSGSFLRKVLRTFITCRGFLLPSCEICRMELLGQKAASPGHGRPCCCHLSPHVVAATSSASQIPGSSHGTRLLSGSFKSPLSIP